jgi:2-dehydro-3-deoxygluconokinase
LPEIISIGEPLVELLADDARSLADVARFRRGWGGDALNFVVAAARLGANAGLLTVVGEDEFGRALVDFCQAEGIDTSRIRREPDGFTGLYLISFSPDGEHAFTYYRSNSAASHLSPEDVHETYVRTARIVHLSGITQAISDSASAAADRAIDIAREAGVAVSYDANLRPKLRRVDDLRQTFLRTVARADIVFLSEVDAALIYGHSSPRTVTSAVIEAGVRVAVLKAGTRGAFVSAMDGTNGAVEAFGIERRDSTGAGDAFAAAFLVEWRAGADLIHAARFGNAVGALVAQGGGAVAAIPTREEVNRFLERASPPDIAKEVTSRRSTG